jgi:hypothetical protein
LKGRRSLYALLALLVLSAFAAQLGLPVPVASGPVAQVADFEGTYSGTTSGEWEGFSAGSADFIFIRMWEYNRSLVTVAAPYDVTPSGMLRLCYIASRYFPGDPYDTTFWTTDSCTSALRGQAGGSRSRRRMARIPSPSRRQ